MKICILPSLLICCAAIHAEPPELIGPFGGSASVVQVDPTHPGVVVAATSNGLLFQSNNSGDSWTRLPFPAELRTTLHVFAIAPSGLYLVGAADNHHEYSGLFLSGDAGQNWSRPAALAEKDVWSIASWSRDPRVFAVGTGDGVYVTHDRGEHWDRISPESNQALMPVVSIDFDSRDSQVVYAGTPHLPWKTTDGGKTWLSAHTGMHDDSDVFSIHVDPNRPDRVFASACSGIYRSSNRALNWTKMAGARDASYRTYQITQSPRDPNVLLAGTTHGLEKSTDGGMTWRKLSSQATRSIAFDPSRSGRIYVATDEAGLFRSDNLGESFRSIDDGFCNRHVISLAALGSTLYASSTVGVMAGVFRDVGFGNNWASIQSLPPLAGQQITKTLPVDPTHLYLLTTRGVLVSADGGSTWNNIGPRVAARWTDLVATSPGGRRLMLASDDGIYLTEDSGLNWQRAHLEPEHASIRALIALGPKSMAAITRYSVLVSPDGAEYKTVSPPASESEINGLLVTEHGDLLAATSQGLRRSEDLGMTWQSIHGNLGNSTVSALCKHPVYPDLLFASRYGAIYKSQDDGRTWSAITSQGEELPAIQKLMVPPGMPDRLLAVTHSQGVFAVHLDPDEASAECQGRNCSLVRIRVQ